MFRSRVGLIRQLGHVARQFLESFSTHKVPEHNLLNLIPFRQPVDQHMIRYPALFLFFNQC